MPSFGKKSLEKLKTCHPDLQRLAQELVKEMDVTVLCGHRNEHDQNQAFIAGNSKLQWPRSKHNRMPSEAIDLAPYPVDFNNIPAFASMCQRIEKLAKQLGIKIKLGRDFSFKDWPHVELHDKAKK